VPKRVDHEERRRQIADALLRAAATRGLHATGMREVAAEAGVSLRLVQYYFGTKEELMLFAMQQLAVQFAERGKARIKRLKETESPVHPRNVIAAILTEGLPADDERRTFTLVYTAYFALSLTDPALALSPLVRNSGAVIDVVAAQLRAAQAAGDTPAHLDPDLEAFSLLAMSAGLGTSVLGGQSSAGQAQAVIDYHLDRLFPASRPALRRVLVKASPAGQRGAAPGPKMPPSRPTAGAEDLPTSPPAAAGFEEKPTAIAVQVQEKTGAGPTGTPSLHRASSVSPAYVLRVLASIRPALRRPGGG
jgi:AcrR family transcriptional regulator